MVKSVSSNFTGKKNLMVSTGPWVWLLAVDVDGTNTLRVAANYDAEVTFAGSTYYPYPCQITDVKSAGNGSIESLDVTVSNVARLVMSYLELGQIKGRQVTTYIAHTAHLAAVADAVEGLYYVKAALASEDACVFTLGVTNPRGIQFPSERFWRGRCRFLKEYGAKRCGYDKTLPNAISATNTDFDPTECDGTLGSETSGNGCKAHGENEAANGAAVLHPKRFGGAPGLPKGAILA